MYLVVPVHTEGMLSDGSVAKQHYWALQTIIRGKKSLVRRVCDYLARKQHNLAPDAHPSESQITAVVSGGSWNRYLTFLNLRNWGVTALFPRDKEFRRLDSEKPLGKFVITEQVYVHSKLLIVDDAIAIIGSANCNDRSLNGSGDTELASVIVDTDVVEMDLGNGHKVNTRKFARELRISLWEKHLGLKISELNYTRGDRILDSKNNDKKGHPDPGLPYPPRTKAQSAARANGVDLNLPAARKTSLAIQEIAKANATVYETVFQHTPRNSMDFFDDTEAGWPKRLSRVHAIAKVVGHSSLLKDHPHTEKRVGKVADKKDSLLVTDFSTLPPQLSKAFMKKTEIKSDIFYKDFDVDDRESIHEVENVIRRELRPKLTGFWIEMPLEFGNKEKDKWLTSHLGGTAVADADIPIEKDSKTEKTLLAESIKSREGTA